MTPRRAIPSAGVRRDPEQEFTYLVNHFGQWVLAVANEAREYHALGFRVFDNTPGMNEVTEFTNPRLAPSAPAFQRQIAEVDEVLDAHEEDPEDRKKKVKGKYHGFLVIGILLISIRLQVLDAHQEPRTTFASWIWR